MNASGLTGLMLCGLLLCTSAQAAEEPEESVSEPAGAQIDRMPPGALPAPAAPPLAGESAPAVPEGSGPKAEAPAEDRAAEDAPPADSPGTLPAPDEGSRI